MTRTRQMISRVFNVLLLTFMSLWLGVIVPVHTRGQIKLPGSQRAADSAATITSELDAHACCAAPVPTSSQPPAAAPCGDDKRSCAICYYIATLDLPPVFDLIFSPAGTVEKLVIALVQRVPALDHPLPIHGRAPPIA